jgi:hypothetical protein
VTAIERVMVITATSLITVGGTDISDGTVEDGERGALGISLD